MYSIIACVSGQHEPWVVPLAVVICWVSCHTTFGLLKQARENTEWVAASWLIATGVAAGAGMWSTHFIAMLGYDPGQVASYDLKLTLLSLFVAITSACAAFATLASSQRLIVIVASGMVLTVGAAAMHFIGMAGVQFNGKFQWDTPLLAAALSAEFILICCALFVFTSKVGVYPRATAATLLGASICILHFVSMAAAKAVPDLSVPANGEQMPRALLAAGIATMMLMTLAFSALALFADRLRRSNRELAEQQIALSASEERLAQALDAVNDALWDWNITSGAIWLSDRWATMLGYDPGELVGHIQTWHCLVHPDDKADAMAQMKAHFIGEAAVYESEHRLKRKDGTWGWVLARGKVIDRNTDGRAVRIVGTHVDISARKRAEFQIAHMARHDGLTGLTNRTHFQDLLQRSLVAVAHERRACAVMCLDLDRFKAVNDTLGHHAGDQLLKTVAERIRKCVGPSDVVARLGGDEFAILVEGETAIETLEELARTLIAAVGQPIAYGVGTMDVGVSIGVAIAPQHGLDEETLFKRADLALYRAKAEGRNDYRLFDASMDEAVVEKRDLEQDLRRAIVDGGLMLHYQPQVLGQDNALVGFEALVRWDHPVRGRIGPAEFIPLAEETGLIADIGEWVLREACREAARWPRPLKIAVNLSARQFQNTGLPELVLGVLTQTGLSPDRLELEVTETALFLDMSRALSVLRRLKALGVRVAMDDFGTGYSSLATLQAFPFDKIKIDRSFVREVEANPQAAVIVKTVLGLGRSLGISVVAEGVETVQQMRFLAAEECSELQGFLFGRPEAIERYADAISGDLDLLSPHDRHGDNDATDQVADKAA